MKYPWKPAWIIAPIEAETRTMDYVPRLLDELAARSRRSARSKRRR
jgi:hypothetical protein